MKIDVKDIDDTPKLLAHLQSVLADVGGVVGDYLAMMIRRRIEKQDPTWPAKATSTLNSKAYGYGAKWKLWVQTGELQRLITARVERGFPTMVKVGIFDHEKAQIAYWIETGTTKMPARPLFAVVADEEVERVATIARTELRKRI